MTLLSERIPQYGALQLKSAALYLLIGLGLGLYMAISGEFVLRPVHTHVNLLGWAAMGFTGVVYCVAPHLAESRLADAHIFLHNLGLPVMMAGLTLYVLGQTEFEPILGVGSVLTVGGLGAFALNVWMRLDARIKRPRFLRRPA